MTYYYGCFVTHYVHDLNLMKKRSKFYGRFAWGPHNIFWGIWKGFGRHGGQFFFLGMLQETLKRMVPSKTFIKSVQFENVLGFLLL